MSKALFVTGTGTDVGKTYATAALAVAGWYAGRRRIAAQGVAVAPGAQGRRAARPVHLNPTTRQGKPPT